MKEHFKNEYLYKQLEEAANEILSLEAQIKYLETRAIDAETQLSHIDAELQKEKKLNIISREWGKIKINSPEDREKFIFLSGLFEKMNSEQLRKCFSLCNE